MSKNLIVSNDLSTSGQYVMDNNGNNSKLSLTKDGNIGIGKLNPQANLDVEGDLFIKGKKPFTINRFDKIGSGAISFDTKKSYDEYMAAIVGFSCSGGDIEEFGKPGFLISIFMNPDPTSRTWFIYADFRTSRNETWDFVDVMFIRRELCAQNG
jgi:hypothetical protein